ncbi:MAG: S-layer homology domain-containing protein [Microcoleaceae cyanobacterium]
MKHSKDSLRSIGLPLQRFSRWRGMEVDGTLRHQLLNPYLTRLKIAISLACLLNACAGSPFGESLERSLEADPQLEQTATTPQPRSTPIDTETTIPTVSLPSDFPDEVPIYPGAQLQEIQSLGREISGATTRWETQDPSNAVQTFYSNQFKRQRWEVTRRPEEEGEGSFEAQKDGVEVSVSIQPSPDNPSQTEFELSYQQPDSILSKGDSTDKLPVPVPPEEASRRSDTPSPNSKSDETKSDEAKSNSQATPSPTASPTTASSANAVPQELQPLVSGVVQTGLLLSSQDRAGDATSTLSSPNNPITRSEFARWLVNANNNLYAKTPAKQIRLAVPSSQPAFTDVPTTHPSFAEIQGLAEAGLIPSSLAGDSTVTQFRPDANLTREDLLLWKVPLDTRQALPTATVDTVKERWGFRDTSKIDSSSLGAVLADFDNGDNSNIRRVYGFTTLFQPKKSVTRAEAAAALWYFGFQNNGISVTELNQSQQLQDSD